MAKFIRNVFKNEHQCMTECADGFWIYDYSWQMNIVTSEKTEQAAFIAALSFYQKAFDESKNKYKDLSGKVDSFLAQFPNEY